jgi:hypothetical protein
MPVTVTPFVGTGAPLTRRGFDTVAESLGVDAPSLWSLVTVETRGFGFMIDKRPKILFERHHFAKRTANRFNESHPQISSRESGGYSKDEYARLTQAVGLDETAAIESASWGLGQVMGFNAVPLGYPSAKEMVNDFLKGEDAQLEASRRFIAKNAALAAAFRARNWATVALHYNGADFARNKYDVKLESHFEIYTLHGTPSIEIRAAQARLTYLGFDPRGVDGVLGTGTRAAIVAFQKARGLPVTAQLDDATLAALEAAAGI